MKSCNVLEVVISVFISIRSLDANKSELERKLKPVLVDLQLGSPSSGWQISEREDFLRLFELTSDSIS